jgi:hypothetical protein
VSSRERAGPSLFAPCVRGVSRSARGSTDRSAFVRAAKGQGVFSKSPSSAARSAIEAASVPVTARAVVSAAPACRGSPAASECVATAGRDRWQLSPAAVRPAPLCRYRLGREASARAAQFPLLALNPALSAYPRQVKPPALVLP